MNENLAKATAQLCMALETSDELMNYNAAKVAYEADTSLSKLITEYNVQATLLEQEGKKPESERDTKLIESISGRLREVYDSISDSVVLKNMREAEEALSNVIAEINQKIQLCIDPDSGNCTHDCSTCGGCH